MPSTNHQSVQFLLDGEVVQLTDVDPNRTLLQWLREDCRKTGTKEGCAEGDCGACTVVVGELNGDPQQVRYRAVNACIYFLPCLDGKELVTVESLAESKDKLHPVQQAMVDYHGSQCGFCTPGFVMSLFALYQDNPHPTRQEIDDALAGNLCRCTGYRPIVTAAQNIHHYDRGNGHPNVANQLQSIQRNSTLAFESHGRRYFAPSSGDDLAVLLKKYPDSRIVAGATDVGLWVTKDYQDLESVIYVGRVAELGTIQVTDTHIEIGAAVTWTDAIPVLGDHVPGWYDLLLRFAGPPIRNVATVGGNVANGSPIGDSMPPFIAAAGTVVLRQGDRRRELALEDFYVDYQQTVLQPGEFVERIRLPLPDSANHIVAYKISKRFDQDISAVCGAYNLTLDQNRIAEVRIAYGGVAVVPKRAEACEQSLLGKPWDESTVAAGMQALEKDFTPISDMRASEGYRQQIVKNLLYKFYLETSQPGEAANVYRYGR